MNILHFEQINNTPALPVAVDAWQALLRARHCVPLVLVAPEHSALLAVRPDEKPLGIITYRKLPLRKAFEVWLGFVYTEFRRIGVYRALWDELVRSATIEGMVEIDSSTNSKNAVMREVAQSQGRVESSVYLRYVL